MLNLLPVNGPGQSLWVHRVFAVAVATATVAPVDTFAYFQSSAQATATATTSVAAGIIKSTAVQAQGRAAAAVQPTLAYAGTSTAEASAFGLAAVRRDVFAEASATGTSVASALLASDIGEVLAFPQPWVVAVGGGLNGVSFSYLTERGGATALGSAQPTKVHPGHVSDLTASATGTATADVTRWAMVDDAVGAVLWTRAEAFYMSALDNGFWQDGQTWEDTESWVDAGWYYHDGYVPAGTVAGTATGTIDNTLVTLIETVGPYNLGQSYAVACTGTLRQPASVTATGLATGLADESWLTYANAQATADSRAQAAGVRTCFGAAAEAAEATALSTRATTRQIGTASGTVTATALAPVAVRTCFGAGVLLATATGAAAPANLYRDTATGSGQATGAGQALQTFSGRATASGTGSGVAAPAEFRLATVSGELASGVGNVQAMVDYSAAAVGIGTAESGVLSKQHLGQSASGAAASAGSAGPFAARAGATTITGEATGTSAARQQHAAQATATGTATGSAEKDVDHGAVYAVPTPVLVQVGGGLNGVEFGYTTYVGGAAATGVAIPSVTYEGTAAADTLSTGSSAGRYLRLAAASAGLSEGYGLAWYARQHFATAAEEAVTEGAAHALMNYRGLVTASAGATATITAFANSDVLAPTCRYLIVAADDRTMPIEADDRLLRVTCG